MKKFLACLVISFGTFLVLKYFSVTGNEEAESGTFSKLVVRVRSHSIREGLNEPRKIGTKNSLMKKEVGELVERLNDLKDFDGSELTKQQILEAVNSIGYAGADGASATSAIEKIFLSASSADLEEASVLTLVRIKSIPQSIEEGLGNICSEDLEGPKCKLVSKLFFRLDLDQNQEVKAKMKALAKETLDQIIYISNHCASPLAEEKIIRAKNAFFNLSVFGGSGPEVSAALIKILKSNCNSEIIKLAVQSISDQKVIDKELLTELSYVMQYSENSEIREEALLCLRRIGSEEALSLVHAYGHKFINGEPKPPEIKAHPFLKWVQLQKK